MEELDSSLRPDRTAGGHDTVNAPKTLTRCCSIPQQLSSLTVKLGRCVGDQPSRPPGQEEHAVAIGTGVYFQNFSSNQSLNSDCDVSELQDLFNLATVACETEASTRNRQVVKKRRTPRNVLWINKSTCIATGNVRGRFPPAGGADGAKRQRSGNLTVGLLYTPPWLAEKSVLQDSRGFASKLTGSSIRNRSNSEVHLKFGPQHSGSTVGGKMMASCQPPKGLRIKFSTVSKGNSRRPSTQSSSKQPRAWRLPGKETRVQGVAKRILRFVGGRSIAEKFIRGALGNNPDTSKALRLLLTQHKVYRVGDGGRGKAFLYVATPAGLRELEQLKDHVNGNDDDDPLIRHRPNHYKDGQISTLKNRIPPTSTPHDVLAAPGYTPRDANTCFPKATISQTVLQTVLGKNKEQDL